MKTFAKGKIITILSLTLTLSVVAACGMLANTYAKYTSEITSTATTGVAKWNFDVENESLKTVVDLRQTADASTLTTGNIAPGTSGSFNIQLTNGTTETGVKFTIALNTNGNEPTNLKFYTDAEHHNELEPGTGTITGKLAAKDATGVNPTIYWQWPYETPGKDAQDIADGKAAKDLEVGITITGVQIEPGNNVITSQID